MHEYRSGTDRACSFEDAPARSGASDETAAVKAPRRKTREEKDLVGIEKWRAR